MGKWGIRGLETRVGRESSVSRCGARFNQQPPQRGGAVPGPVWVGSKWLLAFPRVTATSSIDSHSEFKSLTNPS